MLRGAGPVHHAEKLPHPPGCPAHHTSINGALQGPVARRRRPRAGRAAIIGSPGRASRRPKSASAAGVCA